jgi:hypothetical protein
MYGTRVGSLQHTTQARHGEMRWALAGYRTDAQ